MIQYYILFIVPLNQTFVNSSNFGSFHQTFSTSLAYFLYSGVFLISRVLFYSDCHFILNKWLPLNCIAHKLSHTFEFLHCAIFHSINLTFCCLFLPLFLSSGYCLNSSSCLINLINLLFYMNLFPKYFQLFSAKSHLIVATPSSISNFIFHLLT